MRRRVAILAVVGCLVSAVAGVLALGAASGATSAGPSRARVLASTTDPDSPPGMSRAMTAQTQRGAVRPGTAAHHVPVPPWLQYRLIASKDYRAAMAEAAKHDPACAPNEGTINDAAPDRRLVSVLKVLAGPPSRSVPMPPPLRKGWVQSTRQQIFRPWADGIYVRYVRLARTSTNMYFYITAAAKIPPPPPPARCYSEALTILRASTLKLPTAERNAILDYAQQVASAEQRASKRDPSRAGICFTAVSVYPAGERCGAWAGLIEHHGIAGDGDPSRGVVPNGVASVTLKYRTQQGQANTYNGNVINNVFVIHVAGRDSRISPQTMIWRSRGGKVLKAIPEKGCCSSDG